VRVGACVQVGTLLRFDAQLDFSPGPPSKTYSVGVTATMATPGRDGGSEGKLTNTFHFTFHCDDADSVPQVFPRTYEDAMAYIEAGRRYLAGKRLADWRKEHGVSLRFEDHT
jgi:hypothetical protein